MGRALVDEEIERAHRALRDGSSLRLVGHARLHVDHRDQAWAAQQALEDGLNTADFADCGQLIVVRMLRLRRLSAGGGGAAVARALEDAWRALAPSMLPGSHPLAEAAAAVYFRSASEARGEWLQRVAHSEPVTAWFWPRALPELATPDQLPIALVRVIGAMLSDEPRALGERIVSWPAAAVRRVVETLPVPLPAALKRWGGGPLKGLTAGTIGAVPTRLPESERSPPASPGSSVREQVRRVVGRWLATLALPNDERRAWVAAVALAQGWLEEVGNGDVAAVLGHAEAVVAPTAFPAGTSATSGMPQPIVSAQARNGADAPPCARSASIVEIRDALLRPVASQMALRPAERRRVRGERTSRWPWLDAGQATANGGLLMLLNALRALGLEAWLELQPPASRGPWVALLFDTLADRLRLPAADPQALLFMPSAAASLLADAAGNWQGFCWPAALEGRLPRHGVGASTAIGIWQRALRRALRVHARIGLASVVRRHARVSITPTHVDVVLPLQAVDLRLRRAGLDSDPGWLPWFGWIVKFHYVEFEAGGGDA